MDQDEHHRDDQCHMNEAARDAKNKSNKPKDDEKDADECQHKIWFLAVARADGTAGAAARGDGSAGGGTLCHCAPGENGEQHGGNGEEDAVFHNGVGMGLLSI